MKSLLHILTFLCLGLLVASTHADSIAELYWKTVLPNAKMPNAIKSLLKSDQSNVLEASSNVKDPNEQKAFHLDHGYDKKRGQFSYNSYDASKSKEQATFHLDDDAYNNIKRKFTYHHYGASKSNVQYDPGKLPFYMLYVVRLNLHLPHFPNFFFHS
ncbi:hypothetical protein LIER_00859 [Lithospermum erythrorhizon]|uniref:Organ specific protein n=1 Tax=Lithospermum erythrorhizon TaxID=34254 RepID=A0AAV3NMI4_LITER